MMASTIEQVHRLCTEALSAVLTSDATKGKRELGWKVEKPELEDMVATAWKWHNEHPNGYPD